MLPNLVGYGTPSVWHVLEQRQADDKSVFMYVMVLASREVWVLESDRLLFLERDILSSLLRNKHEFATSNAAKLAATLIVEELMLTGWRRPLSPVA
jgi:hypothetical protein